MTLLHVLEKVPRPFKLKEAVAVATEQLENLIPPGRRMTLKIKSAVRIGKPYREIIQLAQEAQTDLVSMGVRGRGAFGSGGIWFDNLSGDAVGALPRSHHPRLSVRHHSYPLISNGRAAAIHCE